MADLKIITKRNPMDPSETADYFGEESNDLQLDTINDLASISGIEKLKQDIQKILLTERGTNTNFELYGTELQSLIGGKFSLDYAKAKVRDEVIGALQILQFINKDNTNLDEKPDILEALSVRQTDIDTIEVDLSVITESGKRIITGVTIPTGA